MLNDHCGSGTIDLLGLCLESVHLEPVERRMGFGKLSPNGSMLHHAGSIIALHPVYVWLYRRTKNDTFRNPALGNHFINVGTQRGIAVVGVPRILAAAFRVSVIVRTVDWLGSSHALHFLLFIHALCKKSTASLKSRVRLNGGKLCHIRLP